MGFYRISPQNDETDFQNEDSVLSVLAKLLTEVKTPMLRGHKGLGWGGVGWGGVGTGN